VTVVTWRSPRKDAETAMQMGERWIDEYEMHLGRLLTSAEMAEVHAKARHVASHWGQQARAAAIDARLGERAGIDLAAELAMKETRAAVPPPGVVRDFEANANRMAEPAAPIYDRDQDNAAWEAKLAEAAINAEAQKDRQQPGGGPGGRGRQPRPRGVHPRRGELRRAPG